MAEIIPAIIPKSFDELEDKLSLVQGIAPLVQIDILDGKLTSETSWPHIVPNDPDFLRIIHEEEGFPYWEDFDFEFDLMVADPINEVHRWISAGAKRVIVHYESFTSPETVLGFVEEFKKSFGSDVSIVSIELGMALNIDTPNSVLDPLIEYINFAQCMGITSIGKQGEPFDERVLEKISSLRSIHKDLAISVDGGVSLYSAPLLIDAGANRLVAGSAVFGSDDIRGTIERLKSF